MFQSVHCKNSNFTFTGDPICDGSYLQWEHQEKYHGLTEDEVPTLSTDDLEKNELERLKFNAIKVCEQVSYRIEGAAVPDGYLKSFVTPVHEELFFWDREYLRRYIDKKDEKKIVPGYHFYTKLDNFMAKHFRKGEKYHEFVKLSCDDDL